MNSEINDNNIGCLIKQISDKMRARADMDMKSAGLTYSQFLVLGFIEAAGGETSQKKVEEFLGVSHPTVVGLISRLKSKGFVETSTDPKDKRVKRIRATEKTKALGDYMTGKIEQAEAVLVKGLTEEESAELIRLLHIVYKTVKETE